VHSSYAVHILTLSDQCDNSLPVWHICATVNFPWHVVYWSQWAIVNWQQTRFGVLSQRASPYSKPRHPHRNAKRK